MVSSGLKITGFLLIFSGLIVLLQLNFNSKKFIATSDKKVSVMVSNIGGWV
jgi:uncharacterized membrane protein